MPEFISSDTRFGISGSFIELNQIFEKKNAIERPNKIKILKIHKYKKLLFEFFKFIKLLLIKIAAAGIAGSQQLGNFVAEILKKINTDVNQHSEQVKRVSVTLELSFELFKKSLNALNIP